MNKKWIILLIGITLFFTGCDKEQGGIQATSIDTSKYDTKEFSYITCKRDTSTEDNSKVDIQYEIYYNEKDDIEVLKSREEVTSSNQKVLEKYKNAYESIYSVYNDLEYYDHEIIEEEGKIISVTYINYGKVSMDRLMEIEGYEDNVKVTNGKIKLEDWKSFAKKYGTQCSSK
ncbi:MAG: DUF1307 domain-containing protein [Bacilli bacterium]|nr:DUF1307 domain-containing protein [Bacilli bacterium]